MKPTKSTPPGAVVIGAHANGLGVVRSLASLGVDVASISTRPFDIAHVSRGVSERASVPTFHDRPEDVLDLLEARAERWRGWALFPTNDDAVVLLARHHDRLESSYRLTVDPWERMADVIDKDRMDALAKRAALAVPRCYGDAAQVLGAEETFDYPVIVKPLRHERLIDAFGVKVFVASDRSELASAVEKLAAAESPGLVFDYVPGADAEIFVYCVYMDSAGEPSAGLTVQKVRQNPPRTGGARVARVVDDPPGIREASVALMREAKVRGPAFVEFKRDPRDGVLRFIEVNCRAVLFNALPARAGLDLVRATWLDFVESQTARLAENGWRGYWIHLQADLLCSLVFRRQERLSRAAFAAPYRAPHVLAIWEAADPRPFALQVGRLAKQAALSPLRPAGVAALRQRWRGGQLPSG